MDRTTEYAVIADHEVRLLPPEDEQMQGDAAGLQHVFIVGSKGIPAQYGGFETFVEKLTYYRQNKKILYHVARMAEDQRRFEYNGAY